MKAGYKVRRGDNFLKIFAIGVGNLTIFQRLPSKLKESVLARKNSGNSTGRRGMSRAENTEVTTIREGLKTNTTIGEMDLVTGVIYEFLYLLTH